MDGTTTARLNDFVCTSLAANKIDHGSENVRSNLPAPKILNFHINSEIEQAVGKAEYNFEKLIGNHDLTVLAYQSFGKNLIKKFKCSPDSFMQMTIQLAYYRMFGVSRPTYESAQTRKFQRGRTETSRTVSTESVRFVKSMEDISLSTEQKIAAFRAALKAQGAYMADCVNPHGVDRHLFGLKNSLQPNEPKPTLFTDPAYSYSQHWFLSTSQLSSGEFFDGSVRK
jgi:carnitine O-acetyltransferase